MRYWNTEDLSDQEEKFVDIWLELIDEYDTYQSSRRQLAILIDDLILSLEEGNYGDFKEKVNEIQEQLDDISNSALSDVKTDIETELPDIEDIELNRDKLKSTLNQAVDFDTTPISDLDDWWIDVDNLKGRIYSQTAFQADATLFSSLKEGDQLNHWNEVRSEITSEEVIDEFSENLVSSIEDHLTESQTYTREELRDIIEPLFAELQYKNWWVDDIEKVLKQYITNSDAKRDEKRSDFLDKIRQDTEPLNSFVALPEAHLGDLTPLDVGEVTFHSLSDDGFDIKSKKHPAVKDIDLSSRADVWATAEVKGATSKIRARNLKEKVARAVDVFNLGKSAGTLQFPFDESYTVLQESSDGKVLPLQATNDLSDISFSEFASEDDVEDRINHFEDYLTGTTESPLEESIASSIRWYRYANRSPEDEEQFLKYIISIESLLVKKKSESKADNIADRAVSILQFHTEFRQDYNMFFREVYDVRSKIVHSGARNLPEFQQKLSEIERFAALLISLAQGYTGKCESINEVINEVRDEEEELRRDRIDKSPFSLEENFSFEAVLSTTGGTELATTQLEGEFKDDGKYVYYEADVIHGSYDSGISVNSDHKHEVDFEVDGDVYIGRDVVFPEADLQDAFPEDQPVPSK
jgi:hypothetical protein